MGNLRASRRGGQACSSGTEGARLARVSRALVGVRLAGVVLEAGCAWMWVMSPQLTAIYNAEFTARFFERLPWLGVFAPTGAAELDVSELVVRLEVGLGLMSLGYLGGLWAIGSATDDNARAETGGGADARLGWVVVGCAVLFRLTLLVLPGLFSTDVFSYVMYGRIAGISGQNPYVLAPSSFPSDPFLSWVFPFWRDQTSVYGPLWTDFSALLARVSGGLGNFEQVMVYRGSLAAIEAGTLGVLWWVLGKTKPKGRLACWAMYAWNPLVLFDLVGGAHNDVMMVALLLLGVGVIVRASGQQHGRTGEVRDGRGHPALDNSVGGAGRVAARTARAGNSRIGCTSAAGSDLVVAVAADESGLAALGRRGERTVGDQLGARSGRVDGGRRAPAATRH